MSLKSNEGYLLIDHTASPGVPDEVMQRLGFPVGSGKGVFEAPTFTCKHCQSIVIMNPSRNRERAYCRRCDHHLCDACGAEMAITRECKTVERHIENLLNSAAKQPF